MTEDPTAEDLALLTDEDREWLTHHQDLANNLCSRCFPDGWTNHDTAMCVHGEWSR